MKKSKNLSIEEMLKMILNFHPEMKKDRKKFSDYIIAKVVGDFMYDPKIKGSHDEKKQKAKEIYQQLMDIWEKQFEEENKKSQQ